MKNVLLRTTGMHTLRIGDCGTIDIMKFVKE